MFRLALSAFRLASAFCASACLHRTVSLRSGRGGGGGGDRRAQSVRDSGLYGGRTREKAPWTPRARSSRRRGRAAQGGPHWRRRRPGVPRPAGGPPACVRRWPGRASSRGAGGEGCSLSCSPSPPPYSSSVFVAQPGHGQIVNWIASASGGVQPLWLGASGSACSKRWGSFCTSLSSKQTKPPLIPAPRARHRGRHPVRDSASHRSGGSLARGTPSGGVERSLSTASKNPRDLEKQMDPPGPAEQVTRAVVFPWNTGSGLGRQTDCPWSGRSWCEVGPGGRGDRWINRMRR